MKLAKQRRLLSAFSEGGYYCLADGRVVSTKSGGPKTLRPQKHFCGYRQVTLMCKKKRVLVLVHQAVYLFFNGIAPQDRHLNHRDGDKTNNAISNLELVTPLENSRHAKSLGLYPSRAGTAASACKLTDKKVLRIRRLLARGWTNRALGAKFGVVPSTICNINTRKTWGHI